MCQEYLFQCLFFLNGNAVAIGSETTASGANSFAEGLGRGTAFGLNFPMSKATGTACHVEGIATIATDEGAHAENFGTAASGKASHAGGLNSKASGYAAFAHTFFGEASGYYSAAFNEGTKATAQGQFVAGRYNKINPNALFIVGNGTSETDRRNAFEVLKDGSFNFKLTQIASGEYTGTSKAGADNPNSLTFDFKPKFLFIHSYGPYYVFGNRGFYVDTYAMMNVITPSGDNQYKNSVTLTENENGMWTMSWYCLETNGATEGQLSRSDYTYYYFAIG